MNDTFKFYNPLDIYTAIKKGLITSGLTQSHIFGFEQKVFYKNPQILLIGVEHTEISNLSLETTRQIDEFLDSHISAEEGLVLFEAVNLPAKSRILQDGLDNLPSPDLKLVLTRALQSTSRVMSIDGSFTGSPSPTVSTTDIPLSSEHKSTFLELFNASLAINNNFNWQLISRYRSQLMSMQIKEILDNQPSSSVLLVVGNHHVPIIANFLTKHNYKVNTIINHSLQIDKIYNCSKLFLPKMADATFNSPILDVSDSNIYAVILKQIDAIINQ